MEKLALYLTWVLAEKQRSQTRTDFYTRPLATMLTRHLGKYENSASTTSFNISNFD